MWLLQKTCPLFLAHEVAHEVVRSRGYFSNVDRPALEEAADEFLALSVHLQREPEFFGEMLEQLQNGGLRGQYEVFRLRFMNIAAEVRPQSKDEFEEIRSRLVAEAVEVRTRLDAGNQIVGVDASTGRFRWKSDARPAPSRRRWWSKLWKG